MKYIKPIYSATSIKAILEQSEAESTEKLSNPAYLFLMLLYFVTNIGSLLLWFLIVWKTYQGNDAIIDEIINKMLRAFFANRFSIKNYIIILLLVLFYLGGICIVIHFVLTSIINFLYDLFLKKGLIIKNPYRDNCKEILTSYMAAEKLIALIEKNIPCSLSVDSTHLYIIASTRIYGVEMSNQFYFGSFTTEIFKELVCKGILNFSVLDQVITGNKVI